MRQEIHPSAVIHPQAQLGEGVKVGPYTVIGPNVKIGDETVIGPHVYIDGHTSIGRANQIFHGVTIGMPPQDVHWETGKVSYVSIGDENILRENVTIHASKFEGQTTVVHSRCFFMAYSHVAHDCVIHDGVIMANAVELAGHVVLEAGVTLGGLCAIHQFCRIGTQAFLGGLTGVRRDVIPYVKASGVPCSLYGLNLIGLRRRGYSKETITALHQTYKILFMSSLSLDEAIATARQQFGDFPEATIMLDFVATSERGLARPGKDE